MSSKSPFFDVLVLCALAEEAKAFRDIVSQKCNVSFDNGKSIQNWSYLSTTIQNDASESLNILLSWLPRYGPTETALLMQSLLSEFNPDFVAMTGICAGDREKVKLGDLVIADRAFMADSGKLVVDKDGQKRLYDTYTASAARDVLQFARMFDLNKSLVRSLKPPVSARSLQPTYHIAPMASSNAVRADDPFDEVSAPVRGTIAIDMEGAAFYQATENFPGIRSLLVKGVCDFADGTKNDDFHRYASELSALYMLSFIQAYVHPNQARKPHTHEELVSTKEEKPRTVSLSVPSQSDQPQGGSGPIKIFFSYAPEDEDARKVLDKHLVMLRRNDKIVCKYSRDFFGGANTEAEMKKQLSESQIILLLISQDYIASEDVYTNEVTLAYSLYTAGSARVIPILLRPTNDWEEDFFGKLQPLPKDRIPIYNHSTQVREQVFLEVAKGIKDVVMQLSGGKTTIRGESG